MSKNSKLLKTADLAAAHFAPTVAPQNHESAFRNLNARLERAGISLRVVAALQFQDDAQLEASARRRRRGAD